ncbi:MAG: FG-GAP repeat protein [Deltaproteobacteria bacterium]|nr:FG-GAP repeat protein [Deltaproteobacteria bacterium]
MPFAPTSAVLLALLLTGCEDVGSVASDTGPIDVDRDGWTIADGDCDDEDPTVHPDADDECGDGVDQDCDGRDPTCRLTGDVDLGDARIVELTGEFDWGNAGASVAGAGDVNADGYADILVGAPPPPWEYHIPGTVYVLYGPVTEDRDLALADARLIGQGEWDMVGRSIDGPGDVNGDGFADILVGASFIVSDESGIAYTVAYIVYGPVEGDFDLNDADARLVSESFTGTHFAAVAGAGDVDADGFDDLLAGASVTGSPVYIVHGPVAGDVDLSCADATLRGAGGVSAALSSAGDVDGDGLDDILLGNGYANETAEDSGAVYLVYSPVRGMQDLCDADATFFGEHAGDGAGFAVSEAGDVDGDGHADLLVGANGVDAAGSDAGAAYLLYGPVWGDDSISAADARLLGEDEGDRAGWSVSGAGDLDDDGFADILIGAPGHYLTAEHRGHAYLLYGPVAASRDLAFADATFVAGRLNDRTGYAVSHAGDVDADGFGDVLIGAPDSNAANYVSGAAYLVLSSLVW